MNKVYLTISTILIALLLSACGGGGGGGSSFDSTSEIPIVDCSDTIPTYTPIQIGDILVKEETCRS